MVYYTGLARVARKTGYPVVEVTGWKTRGHGGMGSVKTVVCHHTVGSPKGNYPSLNFVKNGSKSLPGPLSQYGLGRDGTIYVIAAGLCYHAGKVGNSSHGNLHAIGIEAENTGTGELWGDKQMDSYMKLCKALRDEFKLSTSDILGHKEIAVPRGRKIDPTFSMNAFRKAIDEGWKTGDVKPAAPAKPKPKPSNPVASKPKVKGWPHTKLRVTSKHSKASDAAWRKLMHDVGYKNSDLGKNLQSWLNDKTDPRTGRPYYDFKYLKQDGIMGPEGVKALQRKLYDTKDPKGHRFYNGKADGSRGSMTVKAEINYLNYQRSFYK